MKGDKRSRGDRGFLSGTLNILGLKLDLGELIASPEEFKERLEELREKLKAAGGKEGLTITGHIRTGGLLGEREFHVGTMGSAKKRAPGRTEPEPVEAVEPPVDVFHEGQRIIIVADVPGVTLEDLQLKVEGKAFSLSTRPGARRNYFKRLVLEAEVDPGSLQATCNNGVLEVRLQELKGPG